LGLDLGAIEAAIGDPLSFVGTAPRQVEAFLRRAEDVIATDPDAATYKPEPIL